LTFVSSLFNLTKDLGTGAASGFETKIGFGYPEWPDGNGSMILLNTLVSRFQVDKEFQEHVFLFSLFSKGHPKR